MWAGSRQAADVRLRRRSPWRRRPRAAAGVRRGCRRAKDPCHLRSRETRLRGVTGEMNACSARRPGGVPVPSVSLRGERGDTPYRGDLSRGTEGRCRHQCRLRCRCSTH